MWTKGAKFCMNGMNRLELFTSYNKVLVAVTNSI